MGGAPIQIWAEQEGVPASSFIQTRSVTLVPVLQLTWQTEDRTGNLVLKRGLTSWLLQTTHRTRRGSNVAAL